MLAKIFLAITGALYVFFAFYCSIFPETASKTVNLEMSGPGGRSEFMTVYGGLEFGMGLIFLLPLLNPAYLKSSLLACLLIHGSLAAFRLTSFALYSGAFKPVQNLAIGEIVIFVITLALWLRSGQSMTS